MIFTQVRIKPEYRDKLAALAADQRRSMTRQLEVLIDQATAALSPQPRPKPAELPDANPGDIKT